MYAWSAIEFSNPSDIFIFNVWIGLIIPAALSDKLHGKQRYYTHDSASEKRNPIIHNPQKAADGRQENGGNVIDGKAHGHTGCDIARIADLLEIGSDRDWKIKENMIQDVKDRHHPFEICGGIGDKYKK